MISSQKNVEFSNNHYEKIKKVYSIWICFDSSEKRANTINSYSITEKHIVGDFAERKEMYDLMIIVKINLSKNLDENIDIV